MLLLQGQISPPPPPPPKKNMTLCVIGRVRFERNCGKMYSRHLFPYGRLNWQQKTSNLSCNTAAKKVEWRCCTFYHSY